MPQRTATTLALATLVCVAAAASVPNPDWLAELGLSPYSAALICSAAYDENLIIRDGAGQTKLLPSAPDSPFVTTPYDLHGLVRRGDTELLALWNPAKKALVLAFRGTSSIGDAIADLKVAPVPWAHGGDGMDGVNVHDGFSSQYGAAHKDIIATLERHPAAEYVVTMGHSLGGAIASVAALDAAHRLPKLAAAGRVRSITFGSPRPGSEAFVARYQALVKHTLRVVNEDRVCMANNPLAKVQADACRDKVTQVPPAGAEYAHVADPTHTSVDTGATVHIGPSFELKLHSLATYEGGVADSSADIHKEL